MEFSRLGNQILLSYAGVRLILASNVRKLKMAAGINLGKRMLITKNGLVTASPNAPVGMK